MGRWLIPPPLLSNWKNDSPSRSTGINPKPFCGLIPTGQRMSSAIFLPHTWRGSFPPLFAGRETKFLNPAGSVLRPYILPSSLELVSRLDVPVIVTEGPVRSLLLSQSGLCSISVVGVWNTAAKRTEEEKAKGEKLKPHQDLIPWSWSGRRVLLAFDQDYRSNQSVLHALIRNLVLFSALGASVDVLQWEPNEGKGLDDYVFGQAGLDITEQKQALQKLVAEGVSAGRFPPSPPCGFCLPSWERWRCLVLAGTSWRKPGRRN